ncbi:DUF47 domain-containing protein [Bacillaceae bacterium Marseille-Q3522]|nr:DUF47 domain-containing protein [Bacillaceae bacterium Marseille-Q3522]
MPFIRKKKFATSLRLISGNLKKSANFFATYKLKNVSDLKIFSETMKQFETNGDTYVHEMIKDLNNAFFTPIKREDILLLTINMDDVLDGLESCAARFEMYSITNADDYMIKFVEAIQSCANEIDLSIELIFTKNWSQLREHAIKIKDYEANCDGILRQSIKHLFSVEQDPIRIIQYKEIYEELEEVADNCQGVANTLETIVMKNG